jgi:hypothetical protein
MARKTKEHQVFEPPAHLDEGVREVWCQVVAAHPHPEQIIGPDLETYCAQVAILRDCRRRVKDEGVMVKDKNGQPVPHPVLAVEREIVKEMKVWGGRFIPPPPKALRRSGYIYDATCRSVKAAKHLEDKPEFEGAIATLKTLAWLIDEAQKAGLAAMEKAAFGTIPTYMKACEALQVTPASLPAAFAGTSGGGEGEPTAPVGIDAWRRKKGAERTG